MNINDIDAEKRLCELEDGLKVMKEKLFDGLNNLTDEESRMCVNHRRLKIKEREELIRKTENELLDRMKEKGLGRDRVVVRSKNGWEHASSNIKAERNGDTICVTFSDMDVNDDFIDSLVGGELKDGDGRYKLGNVYMRSYEYGKKRINGVTCENNTVSVIFGIDDTYDDEDDCADGAEFTDDEVMTLISGAMCGMKMYETLSPYDKDDVDLSDHGNDIEFNTDITEQGRRVLRKIGFADEGDKLRAFAILNEFTVGTDKDYMMYNVGKDKSLYIPGCLIKDSGFVKIYFKYRK